MRGCEGPVRRCEGPVSCCEGPVRRCYWRWPTSLSTDPRLGKRRTGREKRRRRTSRSRGLMRETPSRRSGGAVQCAKKLVAKGHVEKIRKRGREREAASDGRRQTLDSDG